MLDSPRKKAPYTFSKQYRHKGIDLKNKNTTVTAPETYGLKMLALVEGPVYNHQSFMRFKIDQRNIHVGLGLAILNIVAETQYQIDEHKNSIAHGCYIFFSDGQTLSHLNDSHQTHEQMYFRPGDIVKVETNDSFLIWKNETANWEYKMKIDLKYYEWSQARFCVMLVGKDDQVSIMYSPDENQKVLSAKKNLIIQP